MAACTPGQQPWNAYYLTLSFSADTYTEACQKVVDFHNANGYAPSVVVSATASSCDFTYNGGTPFTYPIQQVCEAAEPEGTATYTVCNSSCTISHVVSIETPLLNLTPAQGAQIAAAIVAVWVVALAFRWAIRTLNIDGNSSTSTESE